MKRILLMVLRNLLLVPWMWCRLCYHAAHPDKYSLEEHFKMLRFIVQRANKGGNVIVESYGAENLPEQDGFVMYPNHQGKYDALGIMTSHQKPCTVVIDEQRSHLPIADQFITLIQGTRLDKSTARTQVKGILNVISEVAEGRRYIIFPEGGYYHNRNKVHEFSPGSFQCAIKSKSPIVPVALIDSYKPFELNSLRSVTTQVHFLPPIYYEEYKDMSTKEVAVLTRKKIVDAIEHAQKAN